MRIQYLGLYLSLALVFVSLPGGAWAAGNQRPHARYSCEGGNQHGIVNIVSVSGILPQCSYSIVGPTFQFEAGVSSGNLRVLVFAPKEGGHCVGTAGISIEYTDKNGIDYRADSSDGGATDIMGTCTISINRVNEQSFSATIDATVVNRLAVECDKAAAQGAVLPDARKHCDEVSSQPRTEHLLINASIQTEPR